MVKCGLSKNQSAVVTGLVEVSSLGKIFKVYLLACGILVILVRLDSKERLHSNACGAATKVLGVVELAEHMAYASICSF